MAEPARHTPHQNHLLDALPANDYERIASHLESIAVPLGDVLYESGTKLQHVYFPTTCILSLLYVLEDGASAEIAVVGNEGILGISLFMGGDTTPSRAVVQSAGHAFRLRANLLKDEFGLLDRHSFPTTAAARIALFTYIEGWYNPRRGHSGLGRV
jgi:CRP-like cAMP-binding protein